MNSRTIATAVAAFFCCLPAWAGDRVDPGRLVRTVSHIGEADTLSRLPDIILKAPGKLPRRFALPLALYEARCYRLLGQHRKAFGVAYGALHSKDVRSPEWIDFMLDTFKGIRIKTPTARLLAKKGNQLSHERGHMLPISPAGAGRDRSALDSKIQGFGKTPPVAVPGIEQLSYEGRSKFEKIPRIYENMGCLRKAVDSYIEVIYSGVLFFRFMDQSGSRVKKEKARLWLRVGKLEGKLGHYGLAFSAYLKAAYTHKSAVERAIKGVSQSLAEKPKIDPPDPEYELAKMKRIAKLYAETNVHPLALSVLKKAEAETGAELDKLKKSIREEWQKIIQWYEECIWAARLFYGHKASEVDDWAKVHIPRPSDTFWKPVKKTEKE